jgi:hypothetical protein
MTLTVAQTSSVIRWLMSNVPWSRPALRPTQSPVQWVPGSFPCGAGVTLTTHPHLVPSSRMNSSYNPLPFSACMAFSKTANSFGMSWDADCTSPSREGRVASNHVDWLSGCHVVRYWDDCRVHLTRPSDTISRLNASLEEGIRRNSQVWRQKSVTHAQVIRRNNSREPHTETGRPSDCVAASTVAVPPLGINFSQGRIGLPVEQ